MNCHECREDYIVLLDPDSAANDRRAELSEHLKTCRSCAQFYDEITRTVALLRPSTQVSASPQFKGNVMNRIMQEEKTGHAPAQAREPRRMKVWQPALAAGIAGLLVCGVLLWLKFHSAGNDFAKMPAFSLFREACAAEESLFAHEGITSIFNEIIVKPRTDFFSSKPVMLPLNSLGTSGQFLFDILTIPRQPGERCTVEDRAWRDRATGRFVRVMTIGGKAIFANSYDGSAIYRLQPDAAGNMKIGEKPVAADFRLPASPAELLGLGNAAKFAALSDEKAQAYISDAGPAVLPDGSAARVIKVTMQDLPGLPEAFREMFSDSYSLYTIRKSDNTIAQWEMVLKGQPLMELRRVATRTVEAPGVPWNLAGVKVRAALPPEGTLPSPGPVMMGPSISVQQMAAMSDYETYVFGADPPWTTERRIMAQKDPSGPLSWMFVTAWRAKDGRHVVMIQAQMYNQMFGKIFATPEGPQAQAMMKNMMLSYTSPNGFKVWNMSKEMPMGAMMLKITGDWLSFEPLSDSAGFLIQTPAGMVPALAVNGKLTDEELHALIDSLIPAKEYLKKSLSPAATGAEKARTASP